MDHNFETEKRVSVEPLAERSTRQTDHRIGSYNSEVQFWLACLGSAVGYGNIWRFPNMMYRNGGGVFFIPFFICIVVICLPFFYLEVAYGQLFKRTMHRYFYFGKGKEGYQALSFGVSIILLYMSLLYLCVLAWCVTFLMFSFQDPLPWAVSDQEYQAGQFWKQDYFKKEFLHITDDIFDMSNYSILIIIAFILSCFMTYLTSFKGMDTAKWSVLVITPLPFLILTVLFIKGIFLSGNTIGWGYIFSADWNKLWTLQIWRDAASQVIFSSNIGINLTIHFSSLNPRNQKILMPSVVIPVMNFATSVFAACTLFAFVGHASLISGVEISDMPIDGQELAFVAYPAIVNMLPFPQIWSILFFTMLITIGLSSQYSLLDSCATILYGFLTRYEWFTLSKTFVSLPLTILTAGLAIIFFASGAGYYWLELMDLYAVSLTPIIFVLFELIVFIYLLPFEELEIKVLQNNETFPAMYKFCLKYVSPVIAFILICFGIVNEVINTSSENPWVILIGVCLLLFPLIVTLLVFLFPCKILYAEELMNEEDSAK
ncbi:unnamed protein product [Moneuplotes crassus]|uniref:Uncharacterized protein n=1 Tax=Euplotes crassus TaxID=5936 RepID=A0AAD1UF73_EUPCR|nr:unnamed protein product [Moneuplotes crassus]